MFSPTRLLSAGARSALLQRHRMRKATVAMLLVAFLLLVEPGWWERGGGACPPSLARPRGARMLRDLGRPSGLPRRTDGGKRLQRRGHGSSPAAGDRSLPQSLGLCYRTNCRSRTGAPQRRNRRTRVGIQLETVSLAAAAPQSRRMGWRTSLPGSPRHLPDSGQDPGGPEDCACAVTALATPRVSTRDTESSLIPHAGRGDPPRHRAPPRRSGLGRSPTLAAGGLRSPGQAAAADLRHRLRPPQATAPNSQLGLFITTVRDGFNNRWRLLEVSVKPYD